MCEDQAENVNLAIEKMKKLSNTPDDSAALAAICLDYVRGPTLQERFVGLAGWSLMRSLKRFQSS